MFNDALPRLNKDERNQVETMLLANVTGSCNCIWSTSIDCAAIKRSVSNSYSTQMTHQELAIRGLPHPGRTVISAFSTCAIDSEVL